MKFRLRTIFVAIAVISLPLGWIAYQLNWIRQRQGFLSRGAVLDESGHLNDSACPVKAPWELSLFGEPPVKMITVPNDMTDEARRMFPESFVVIEMEDFRNR